MSPYRIPPTRYEGAKWKVDELLRSPVTDLVLVVLILTSVILVIVEVAFRTDEATARLVADTGDMLTWVFVVELCLRFWAWPRTRGFFWRSSGRFVRKWWIDLIAVFAPLLVFLPGASTLRTLRLLRVLRFLRLFRVGLLVNRRVGLFQRIFRGAATELILVTTVGMILVLAAAMVLYVGEGRLNPDFDGLLKSFWFSIYSLLGGEPIGGTPRTLLGQAVTLGLMFGSLVVVGIVVGIVSTFVSDYLARPQEVTKMELDELNRHVLICGWNHSGPYVVEEVFEAEGPRTPVVIVTESDELPDDPALPFDRIDRSLIYHVSGDYTRLEVLQEAGVERATMAILLSDKTVDRSDQDRDARTVLAALTIERVASNIFTCAELRDRQNESLLRHMGVEEIVVADEYSGYILGTAGRTRGLVTMLNEILTARYGNAFHKIPVTQALAGRTVLELHTQLKEEHHAVLVSVQSEADVEEGPRVQVNPRPDHRVAEGDHLVVISEKPVRL